MKSTLHYLLLGLTMAGVPLLAEADADVYGHGILPGNAAMMVEGSPSVFDGVTELMIEGLQVTDGGQVIMVKNCNTDVTAAILAPSEVIDTQPLKIGSRIAVATQSSGWSLSQADQLIAFVPNEEGAALLHKSSV